MSNLQIKALELSVERKKTQVELNNALERLKKNKDFQKVVVDGYLKNEAIRLVSIKGDPDVQTASAQTDILRDIDGIGSFSRYVKRIERNGEQAASAIADDEATLEELHAEALEEQAGA